MLKTSSRHVLKPSSRLIEDQQTFAVKLYGNDGLPKEFYETFWECIEEPLLNSTCNTFLKQELSSSQKQAVIKHIEKKNKDERFVENWRPISLLNVVTKLISKTLATRVKYFLRISQTKLRYYDYINK